MPSPAPRISTPSFARGLARGLTADIVGAPVDLAAMLLNTGIAGVGYAGNKLGFIPNDKLPPLIENPIGGSDWFAGKNTPLTDDNSFGFTAGRLSTIAIPSLAKGLAKIPVQRDSSPNALVWHGSPHKFDKFDSSKIGTGEGAQAYGQGLYFAENPKVAASYQKALGPGAGNADDDTIARLLEAVKNPEEAAKALEARAAFANIPGGKEQLLTLAARVRAGYDPRGSLYKVNLPDEQIARMLDFDKPLGAQREIASKIFDAGLQHGLYRKAGHKNFLDFTGADVIRSYASDSHSAALLADDLSKLGVPGVRYLDGNSRVPGVGTSNYVVFPGNESFLQILERNGIPLNSGLAKNGR